MGSNTAGTPMENSRSYHKAKIVLMDMKVSKKTRTSVDIILTYFPKGEQNWSTTNDHVQVECTYYGMGDFMNKFCVSNKWWNTYPLLMNKERDVTPTH